MPERSEVENQELTLDNLVDYLEDVIKYLQIIEDQDVVLALGVTGCGKSCIFQSLVYGSDQVEIV